MPSLMEMGLYLLDAIPPKVKIAAVPVVIGVAGIVYTVLGGKGESSVNVSTAGNGKDKTPTPALLSKTLTPTRPISSPTRVTGTPTKEIVQPPNITTQNGTRYSSAYSPQFPVGCLTTQFGPKKYMEEGGGTSRRPDGGYYTAWRCTKGNIVMNPANPVKPGTWH